MTDLEGSAPVPAEKDVPRGLRDVDDDARTLARRLLDTSRFATIGVIEPETGFPAVSRVIYACDAEDNAPVILISDLAAHTRALAQDDRCTLLVGEPDKGDPLAHPRMTVYCRAERIDHETAAHERLRPLFLARHPKAALYADFQDFHFWKLTIVNATLNGGFGRAYILQCSDIQ